MPEGGNVLPINNAYSSIKEKKITKVLSSKLKIIFYCEITLHTLFSRFIHFTKCKNLFHCNKPLVYFTSGMFHDEQRPTGVF
jgi:hypothetical protein